MSQPQRPQHHSFPQYGAVPPQGPPYPYGQPPRPSPLHNPLVRAGAVGAVVLLIGVLLFQATIVGAVLFLVAGILYALLLWRGMPFFADTPTTLHYVRALFGAPVHAAPPGAGGATTAAAAWGGPPAAPYPPATGAGFRPPTGPSLTPGYPSPPTAAAPTAALPTAAPSSPVHRPPSGVARAAGPSSPDLRTPVPAPEAAPETALIALSRPTFTEVMALDPATPAATLNAIAGSTPELHVALARNPSTYPDLLAWLGSLGDPAVDAELARRARSGRPESC